MPATAAEFLKQLEQSHLLRPADLAQVASGCGAEPKEIATRLVNEGLLTRWQAEQLLSGTTAFFLGRYKLLNKLGEGGMGAVYKGQHGTTGRIAALKVMSKKVLSQPGAVSRFLREVRSISALDHPNFVAALDANEVNGTHFLVMEYVEGRDLKDWIKQHGRLPIDWSCECIRQAALALEHAHAQGLVHRDIKPSNILVVSHDASECTPHAPREEKGLTRSVRSTLPHVKILDMGLATFTSDTQQTCLTQTGQCLGTIDYISPEQARDTKSVDIRADIFSLGASLFHLLTGQVPFIGKNPMEKLMARAMRDAPRASTLRPELPPELDDLLARMLARKREERPATPAEVARLLAPYSLGTVGASDESSSLSAPTIYDRPGSTVEAAADGTLGDFLASLAVESSGPDVSRSRLPGGTLAPGETAPSGETFSPDATAPPVATISAGETEPARSARSRPAGGTYYALAVAVALALGYFLWPRPATITLDWPVKDRAGAMIKIDGQPATMSGDPEWRVSVAGGKHEVEITRADYPPLKLTLTAGRGEQQRVSVPSPLQSHYSPAEAKSAQERWSQHLGQPVESSNTIGMVMVLIPPGEFLMGTSQAEVERLKTEYKSDAWFVDHVAYEAPEHRVRITRPFILGKHEVTQGQYEQLMGTNPSHFKVQGPHAPVEQVSWYEAVAFCNKLSEREKLASYYRIEGNNVTLANGTGYRLPTEAEWEYACRAGTTTQWSSADDPLGLRDHGWFLETADGKTHAVGEKQGNGLGLGDMHGNVWEWCWDWHGKYDAVAANDPTGPSTGSVRVARGVCWSNPAWHGRCAIRSWRGPADRHDIALGFRLALSVPVNEEKSAATKTVPITGLPAVPPGSGSSLPDEAWIKRVQALSAEAQIAEVSRKLKELNPGFDGKLGTKIENGSVVELGFSTEQVVHIWPVRAFSRLARLGVTAAPGKGRLTSLEPLRGMKLNSLYCYCTSITDLAPLAGQPLTHLNCNSTKVTSLEPLRGMKLSTLDCSYSGVTDLAPLAGQPLTGLVCESTRVTSLEPLRGMKLNSLNCQSTGIADLAPLAGQPLRSLNCRGTRVWDLSPLKDMPLRGLSCNFNIWRDWETLKSLKSLAEFNGAPAAQFWQKADAERAAFDAFAAEVSKLAPEEQVAAVSKKLKELNPGFDGKLEKKIVEGAVTELRFSTAAVLNIWPVRALSRLEKLKVSEVTQKGRLTDLGPLATMKLTHFECNDNPQLTSLEPLRGMKLQTLNCSSTGIKELAPLSGQPLKTLSFTLTKVTSLEPLRGMKLDTLNCHSCGITDLAPLRSMPLTNLVCSTNQISDLEPLRGMSLRELHVHTTQISDLSPVAGMPLLMLNCHGTKVSDLTPLANCPLTWLDCMNTPVADLSPLKGKPVTFLEIANTKVTDLTLLKSLPLKTLRLTYKPEHAPLLRSIKTLEVINGIPAVEFWKTAPVK